MVYVSAPIVKVGDTVKFMVELEGTIVNPGPLTKEQNKLGLLNPLEEDGDDQVVIISHEIFGIIEVLAYWVT